MSSSSATVRWPAPQAAPFSHNFATPDKAPLLPGGQRNHHSGFSPGVVAYYHGVTGVNGLEQELQSKLNDSLAADLADDLSKTAGPHRGIRPGEVCMGKSIEELSTEFEFSLF